MTGLQQRIEAARHDRAAVVLEGVHALKHALRFGARVDTVVSPDPARLRRLLADLAPDVGPAVDDLGVEPVDDRLWDALTRGGLPSPALALARRPDTDPADAIAASAGPPVVLLDKPAHLGNVGAVVRVAAAAGAAAVVVRGGADPWHPTALRGGAGLQFALPVGQVDALPESPRPLVAVHPEGRSLFAGPLPRGALLAFGTERHGLAADLLDRAVEQVAIPMRPGVSSLNLATAVAVTLYAGRGSG